MASIGTISTSNGLISGIDYGSIIQSLLKVYQQPIQTLQNEIQTDTQKQTAYMDFSAHLLGLQGAVNVLGNPNFFNSTQASSSNPNVLTASGNNISALGTYTFVVNRLAQSNQVVSQGLASQTSTVGSGTLTLELGNGFVTRDTRLDSLRGGAGVQRGSIQITNKSNNTFTVNLAGAVTVQDALDAINNTPNIGVLASVQGDRIKVVDQTGGAGSLIVGNVGTGTTASDLGIAGTTAGTTVFGSPINFIANSTLISALNDGNGVRSVTGNDFSITPRDGVSFNVDIPSTALTVNDVLTAINTAVGNGGRVTASLSADGTALVLNDSTAGAGALAVAPLNNSNAVIDLGLYGMTPENATTGLQNAANGNRLVGRRLIPELDSVLRTTLNGGVRLFDANGTAHTDLSGVSNGTLKVTDRAGASVNVSLIGRPNAMTLSAAAANGAATLTLSSTADVSVGSRIRITDGTNTETHTVTAIAGNVATLDAPISTVGGFALGSRVYNENIMTAVAAQGATSITVASTAGLAVGTQIRITNGTSTEDKVITGIAGSVVSFDAPISTVGGFASGTAVYQNKDSLSSILATLNGMTSQNGVKVSAQVDASGNGILLQDTSGSTVSNLMTAEVGTGTSGTDLGIITNVAQNTSDGSALSPAYISENTLLSSMNQGKGVYAGKFIVSDRSGKSFTVDITSSSITTVGQVLTNINGAASLAGSTLVARINDTGNGILLVDSGPGVGKVKVAESSNGTSAADLNILGQAQDATPDRIDGSFRFSLNVASTDTLQTVVTNMNNLGLPITASIINDGSATNPYRLSVASNNTGKAARFIARASSGVDLNFSTITRAEDSVLQYGPSTGSSLLVEKSNNLITDLVNGMSIQLVGTSSTPVTVTVVRDTRAIEGQVQKFVDNFNQVMSNISDLTKFDPNNAQNKGILLGDDALREVKDRLFAEINSPVTGIAVNQINVLQKVGVSVVDGKLSLDTSQLDSALQSNFDQVKALFSKTRTLDVSTLLSDLNNGRGVSNGLGNDLQITRKDGVQFSVDIGTSKTIGDVLTLINSNAGNTGALLTASIGTDGKSLLLTDNSVGVSNLQVLSLNGGTTASDLGIAQTVANPGSTLQGSDLNLLNNPGKGDTLSQLIQQVFLDPTNGLVSLKINGLNTTIQNDNQQISDQQKQLNERQAELVQIFANLESFLAQSQGVQQFLASSLTQLNQTISSGLQSRSTGSPSRSTGTTG